MSRMTPIQALHLRARSHLLQIERLANLSEHLSRGAPAPDVDAARRAATAALYLHGTTPAKEHVHALWAVIQALMPEAEALFEGEATEHAGYGLLYEACHGSDD